MVGTVGYQSAFTETTSGRVNMAARWYNPATGQFDNRDAVGNNPTPNSANANRYAYANNNPLTNIDPDGHRAWDTNDDGSVFMVMPSINGGPDVAWGVKGPAKKRYQQPNRNNYRTPRTGYTSTHVAAVSAKDLDDSASRRDLNRTLDDVKNRAEELLQDALAKCHSIRCEQAVYDKAAAGAYDWVDRGDGTMVKADGGTLVIFTDDNRVAAVKQQQQAAEAAQAKAAACSKSWWCSTKKWATDHAGLVGAIYGASCLTNGTCTASGLASAAATGAVMGAIGGGIGGAKARPSCDSFDPATPVLLADRTTKPIKDIKVGDKVTATDPTTGKTTT